MSVTIRLDGLKIDKQSLRHYAKFPIWLTDGFIESILIDIQDQGAFREDGALRSVIVREILIAEVNYSDGHWRITIFPIGHGSLTNPYHFKANSADKTYEIWLSSRVGDVIG